jgi:hypothetical protein
MRGEGSGCVEGEADYYKYKREEGDGRVLFVVTPSTSTL